jgi:CO dehydrogenase/acetyl-CoA synthase alpha subunit
MDTLTADRTLADVEREISAKRRQIVASLSAVRDAQELVLRAESHTALLEAQMAALATEAAELARRANRVIVGSIPANYKPTIFDPQRRPAAELEPSAA